MSNHPLHQAIGKLVSAKLDKFEIIKDPACETKTLPKRLQNIPLFCCDKKSNETEYCNVDILLLKNEKIKVIIEIEETNIKPTQICGKFLTSALSRFFIHKSKEKPIEMDNNVLFIQILDTSKLDPKSNKQKQWQNIEKSLKEIIPMKNSPINQYKILWGTKDNFVNSSTEEGKKLVECIKEFISQNGVR